MREMDKHLEEISCIDEKLEEMACMEEGPPDSVDACLVRFMHRYSSRNFKKFLEMGIHPGQLPVLRFLSHKEGISLREMADFLHIKPPTVTVTVQRLEKAGIVCKRADREDLRVSRIYLTEKGKAVIEEIQELLRENEKVLTQGFSEEEVVQLKSFLDRMMMNLAGKDKTAG